MRGSGAMHGRTRRWSLVAMLGALAVVGAACSGGGEGGASSGSEAEAGGATVEVTLVDFKIEPATIEVPSGRAIAFNVSNQGQAQHTFAVTVDGRTFDTGLIDPNDTAELDVPALAAGSYTAICSVPGHEQLGMVATVVASAGATTVSPSSPAGLSAQEMADSHKAAVDAFLAGNQTSTQGNRPLRPTMDGPVKVFTLTARDIQWEISKGKAVNAMAFNGQVPGPEIRVRYGDRVRFVLQNQMVQPTTLHFHGMTVPNEVDGVPYLTQDAIMSGEYWTYEFTVKDPPGMYVYHSHFNSAEQVGSGLYGAIIVEPPAGAWPYRALDVDSRTGVATTGGLVKVDEEYTLFLGDGPLGYVLNGKSFPATSPLTAKKGDWVLIHIANDGAMLHPMHLHGYHFEVVGQDGFPLEQPYMADTLVIAPGQRFDVLVRADYPGAWALHCHILPHAEGPQGLSGMVTALVVK